MNDPVPPADPDAPIRLSVRLMVRDGMLGPAGVAVVRPSAFAHTSIANDLERFEALHVKLVLRDGTTYYLRAWSRIDGSLEYNGSEAGALPEAWRP